MDAGCAATGTAYVRGVGTKAFEALPLRSGLEQGRRQLTVVVPDRLGARRGFEYYAVLEAPDLDRADRPPRRWSCGSARLSGA